MLHPTFDLRYHELKFTFWGSECNSQDLCAYYIVLKVFQRSQPIFKPCIPHLFIYLQLEIASANVIFRNSSTDSFKNLTKYNKQYY